MFITDLPCIISGDTFAVLDPHKVHINCKDEDGVPLTGTEISIAELCSSSSLLSCYNGLFGFELPLDDDNYPGTIFRFPLRTPHAKSKLSETTYSRDKVYQNLFCSLKEEATMLLLFLKSVTSISLYEYDHKIDEPYLFFNVSIDAKSIPQVQVERGRCIELASEWQARQNTIIRLYSLTVNITDAFYSAPFTTKSFHLVLNSIGTSDEEINAKAEQLKVIPWVGIAAPCSFPSVVENCEMSVCGNEVIMEVLVQRFPSLSRVEWQYIDPVVSGHAFCFLPLPNPTGLPVSINGYFSIADNRRSIKWPTHDEHGKGADFNKELVMKMVSYAYAVMITCRCQLVSYVNTPSYLSTKLSDTYSIWPLMSQVTNHPIWPCLVEPVVRLLIGQKVVWTAAGGGKWVRLGDAYYQPEDLSIPNAVVDLLLEIEIPFVVLPTAILDSIKTVHSLAATVKSREITPGLLRKIMKQLEDYPKATLNQAKCINILSFILSDFSNSSNIDSLLGINIIPLMDETAPPKELSRQCYADVLYILENDKCASFLPGISSHIIANNLPNEVIIKLKQLSQTPNMNVKLADDGVVCKELLPLSLRQWQIRLPEQFTWYPGQGKHPPLKWIFYLWKWLADVDIKLIWNYAIVPQEKLNSSKDRVKIVNLLSLSKCNKTSLTLDINASGMDNTVAGLLKALGVIIINKSPRVFQNSGLYDCLLDLTSHNVITVLNVNSLRENIRISSIQRWKPKDKQIFFQYLSAGGDTLELSSAEMKLVKNLPIFRKANKQEYATLHNRNYYIVQQPFGLIFDTVNVLYPDNVFYCTVEETKFLCALGCTEITFYDYCVKYFIPFCTKQNTMQKKKNFQWIISCASMWCDRLTNHLQSVSLVTTANTHRMVKASDLYDPEEPAVLQLFCDSEDELPSREYQQFLPQLRRLGLTTWNMITSNSIKYEKLLRNRAQSVRLVLSRNSRDLAMKRSLAVVTYLVDYFTRYDPSCAFETNIKSVKFLFCASKPTSAYPTGVQWSGLNDAKNIFSPNELYCSENSLLVGGTGKILSRKYLNFTSCTEFQDLFKVPDMITVIDQLNLLIASEPTGTYPTSVYAIYDYFNNNLDEFEVHCNRLHSKWIWVGNQKCFEGVSKFAMHPFAGKQLEPFCYAIVQAPQLLKYEQIFSTYGISDVFPEDTMLNVISQLQKHTSQLNSGYLDVVISILDWVHEANRETGEVPVNILIPTNDYRLLPSNKCIFDDRGWSQDRYKHKKSVSGYSFAHRRLPLDTATFFGVKLLSQHLLPSVNLSINYKLTGPHQPITRRIKEALEDYDQDIDVFKEMIQNAEDAGASEIKFVIDWRNHPTEYLLTKEMEAWQGPALLVYNNAVFSDEDFTNICEIAGASKKIDPTKIGRFGIGFCSVYHITDVPSFVSRNFYTVFDPNLLYLKERVTSANPGMQIDFKAITADNLKEFKDQFTPFCGLFHCDILSVSKCVDGTLFRLPFRTEHTAQKSKISHEIYLKERINKLVKMVRNKAPAMLMFLHKIQSISLYEIRQPTASSMQCLLHVERKQTQPKVGISLLQLFKSNPLTSKCQTRKFIIKSAKSENYWMVISCLGDGKSLEIARSFEGRQKGLCPFGEISVKLDPVLLSPCKSVGSLFCFMPVPIKSNFHFLINGYFDISRDRRSLKKDEHGNLTEWNSALIQDTIGKCFLQMLQHLDLTKAMEVDSNKCLEAYYSIWPYKVDKQGSDYNQILYNSIKKLLLETDAELLWSYDKWVCPKIAHVYLNVYPTLPVDHKNEIISLLLKYGYPMVDIPSHVQDLLSPKIITYKMFCRDVLFEYLDEIDSNVRDNQVVQLLTHCTDRNGWELILISTNDCIPTKPNKILKKPRDLVDPKCSLAELYSEEDDCFPWDTFCESNTLSSLRNCGMTFINLSAEQVRERASTINRLPDDKAYDRSQKLVKYITITFTTYNSSTIADELNDIKFLPVMKCPKDVELPWYNTTASFETPRKIYSNQYQNLLFTQEPIYNSFSYLSNILEILKQNKIPTLAQVLEHFKCLICHWQNNKVNNEATNKLIRESCKAIYEYLQTSNVIVKHKQHEAELQQLLKDEIGDLPFVWQNDMFLSADNVVLQWSYVPYSDLLCDLSKDPENKKFENLFQLLGINESPTLPQCMSILKRLHDKTDGTSLPSDAIEFCSGIAKYLAYKLSIGDIIKGNQESELLNLFYLPDESRVMRHFRDLAYKASIEHSSLQNSDLLKSHFKGGTYYWLHKSFSADIAKCLGIPSALESILQKTINYNFLRRSDYGQHEDLCDRINSLLDKYPNDATMFKEFIQNAEDAGASEIAFIIDQRVFPAAAGELFSDNENWSRLHKLPSLLIYNNKTMTEDDLIGITKLGRGNKRDSLESIGRFGVGFNVAYHITECPMFVSYGPGGVPENLCVLDPTCQYAPYATKASPGIRWELNDQAYVEQFYKQLLPMDIKKFREFKKFSSECMIDLNKSENGCVVFRLPLTKLAPKVSKISPKSTMSIQNLKSLFKKLAKDAHKLPLFIKNLKCISAFEISEDGKCSHYFTTTVSLSKESMACKNKFSNNVECICKQRNNHEELDFLPYHAVYAKNVTTTISHSIAATIIPTGKCVGAKMTKYENSIIKEEWLLSEQFGSSEMPNEIVKAGFSASLTPLGGVAILLHTDSNHFQDHHIFCSLPLPLKSYLPLHVNGHFWVDDSRKHLETGADNSLLSKWNECLTTTVISSAYLVAIKECRKYIDLSSSTNKLRYYDLFPSNCFNEDSKMHSFGLIKNLYASMILSNSTILQKQSTDKSLKKKVEWISVRQACFLSDKYKNSKVLSSVILAFKLNLTNAPIQIYYQIDGNKLDCPDLITPEYLIKFLKSIKDIEQFENLIECNIEVLLNYCLLVSKEYDDKIAADYCNSVTKLSSKEARLCSIDKDADKNKIMTGLFTGVPLLLTHDGCLRKFNSEKPAYHYDYAKYFPHRSEDFIDQRLTQCKLDLLEKCGFIQKPNIKYLAQYTTINDSNKPVKLCDVPDIENFWTCLRYIASSMLFCEISSKDLLSFFNKKPIILGSDQRLYPLCRAKMVLLKFERYTPPAFSVMIQLGYPILDTDHEVAQSCSSLFTNLVASPQKGDDVVESIHLHQKTFLNFDTSCFVRSEEDLRRFINILSSSSLINQNNYVSDDYVASVCKLPIFKTYDGKFEPLNQHRILLPNEYKIIPIDGLETVVLHSSKQILIPEGMYNQIYKCLNLNSPTLEDFYIKFIFKHIVHMNNSDIFEHIDLLRRKHCIVEKAPVSEALQHIPFMEDKIVSEYYDPEIEVFRTFLPSDAFPPSPWNDNTWLPVLRILDLQKIVTGKKLVEFAKDVENTSQRHEEILHTIQKAKVLLGAVGERMCDKKHPEPMHFCEELSSIKFIPTFIDTKCKYLLQKFTKENIGEYFECKFIPFQQAIIPRHQGANYYHISFTSNTVIDWLLENLHCSKSDQDKIAQMLHMNVQPSCATVVDNLLTLSKLVTLASIQSACNFDQRDKYVADLQRLFDAHYGFLENYCKYNSGDILKLRNTSFIFVCKEESKKTFSMVQCNRMVKFMNIQQDFSPYLFIMPNYFSRYIDLIKLFNICEKPTSSHFAEILKELYFEFSQSELPLKCSCLCLSQAEVAFNQLIEMLEEEDTVENQQVFYLLDEDDSLHLHSELVYNDAPWYSSRLSDGSYHYMKQPAQEKKGKFSLPKCLQVPLLSSLIIEEISSGTFTEDNECMDERLARQLPRQSNGCEYVVSLKSIIKSPEFKTGLRRIIHHQTGNAPSQKDEATISKLDALEFECYRNIETVLIDIVKNMPIHNSGKKVFCAIHNDSILCIAPHTKNLDEVVNAISLKLNNYLDNMVRSDLHIVQMVKSAKPEDIKMRLDQLRVKQYNLQIRARTIVGDLLKTKPESSDQVVFENFNKKEQIIYWNNEGNGIFATVHSLSSEHNPDDINLSNSITLTVNDDKTTVVTTLFCVSKMLHPSKIQGLNLDGQQRGQTITGDLLLYDIPHEHKDKAIAWITSIVRYCNNLPPRQHCFVLERLKFYTHYYLTVCHQAQHIYNAIVNILDSAVYDIKRLIQHLDDSLPDDDHVMSQSLPIGPIGNAFSQSRLPHIRPPGTIHGYYRSPLGGYRLHPTAGTQYGHWGPPIVVEERPQVNFHEAQIWYHQASADYQACECLIQSSTTATLPGGFKCQHCALVCFLSHEIVDLSLKALCHAFIGLSIDLRNASNILIFYKQLISSPNCPSMDIEQYVHQVSEYDKSTRFPDAHVPSEPPCCVYDEVDAYNALIAAQKVFKCVGEMLSSIGNQGIMTLPLIPVKKGKHFVIYLE